MLTTIRYIFLTAIRDKLFIALFIAIVVAIGISVILGGTALAEQSQMVISYVAASSRLILLIGLIIFVCFHVRRAFDNREIELILSRPISRHAFIFSYWLGFAVISLLIIIPTMAVIALLAKNQSLGALYFALSLICESLITIAFALFVSLLVKSAVSSVLACFGFYFISRSMGFFLVLLQNSHHSLTSLNGVMEKLLYIISIIIPRFDLFGLSKWLVYGMEGAAHAHFFLLQSLIYIPFLLLLAISDFRNKQF